MRTLEAEGEAEVQMKEEARDELLAMVSHELRAPTTAILGWAELIAAGQPDDENIGS